MEGTLMKKCPKCSKEFTDDIVYCTACNTPLEKVEQTTNTDTKNTQSETAYTQSTQTPQQNTQTTIRKIGRASCRERV